MIYVITKPLILIFRNGLSILLAILNYNQVFFYRQLVQRTNCLFQYHNKDFEKKEYC